MIDADAIVALKDVNDSGHQWANKMSNILLKERWMAFLSSYAFGEALTVVSMKLGLNQALSVVDDLADGDITIIDVSEKQRLAGLAWFRKQTSKNARFTDCVNMALMEELKIKEIFSRDGHYQKMGFRRLGLDG